MHKLFLSAGLAACLALPIGEAAASSDTTELKATLQASMQRDLERQMIDGAIAHLDL
ncbi:hypothetical protein [Pseudaestuariivita atlantica]|uniref:hypothetical protein n=1 Tax=Pseudaestuariivita atlantica TaxID=1317121 RepID=UPI0013F452B4|nr:hypothetical protein [Pseudaestuariivita atlantica]